MIRIGGQKISNFYIGDKPGAKIYIGTDLVWQRSSTSYLPIIPSDLNTYPIVVDSYETLETTVGLNDSNKWYAATDGTFFGYYKPSSGEFHRQYGMVGDVMQRVEYIEVDNVGSGSSISVSNYMIDDGLVLTGADTVEMELYPTASGRNTFGWYNTASSTNNYSLYLSTGSSYCRYNGGLYRSLGASSNNWHTIKFTTDGSYVDNVKKDSWDAKTFTCGGDFYIFNLPNSTSARFDGMAKEIKVNGGQKAHIVPIKAGTKYHYFDMKRWVLCSEHSQVSGATPTFSGGSVVDIPIDFPNT